MSALEPVMIPDLGDIQQVDVIELPVQLGTKVKRDDVLLVLESDKATMEVVAPCDGILNKFLVKEGDSVTGGQKVAELESDEPSPSSEGVSGKSAGGEQAPSTEQALESKSQPPKADSPDSVNPAAVASQQTPNTVGQQQAQPQAIMVEKVPDLGDISSAEVIELCVSSGDAVKEGDPLVVLESDKASMEVPATKAGVVEKFLVKIGDSVGSGSEIALLSASGIQIQTGQGSASSPASAVNTDPQPPVGEALKHTVQSQPHAPALSPTELTHSTRSASTAASAVVTTQGGFPSANVSADVHAGPAVRRLANELHVDLSQVLGSGPRGRILKEDVHAFVNHKMKAIAAAPVSASGASVVGEPLPDIDFAQWGEVEQTSLSRIQKISAQHLHRSWSALPHVTQFEEADITALEAFRKEQKARMAERGVKLTPLAFIMKACMLALAEHPKFKASLKPDGVTLVMKHYCHIGFACETPNGLVVPVVKDVDKKSISELANEIVALSVKAREKRLKPDEMKGAVFSISSLGGIGGTAFTPIINWPEVAILGVSRNAVKPVWMDGAFQPRTVVPLSLSYDHRVIDGADAARFTSTLKQLLEDLRTWIL